MAEHTAQAGSTFSGGKQQMLAMARFMLAQPDVILIDEGAEGLSAMIVAESLYCTNCIKFSVLPDLFYTVGISYPSKPRSKLNNWHVDHWVPKQRRHRFERHATSLPQTVAVIRQSDQGTADKFHLHREGAMCALQDPARTLLESRA